MHRSLIGLAIILTTSLHAQEVRRTPLVLTQGGTPEQPAVFDGKGMIMCIASASASKT